MSRKFKSLFRWVWYFNALGIAVAICIVLLMAAYGLYEKFDRYTENVYANNVIQVDDETAPEIGYKIGTAAMIDGYPAAIMPLYANQYIDRGYYSKASMQNVVNYAFFNYDTQGHHWLFAANDNRLIINTTELTANSDQHSASDLVQAYFYQIVTEDMDEDGVLTHADHQVLAMSTPLGGDYTILLEGIESIGVIKPLGSNRALVKFEQAGLTKMAMIDLVARAALYTKAITIPR